VFWKQQVNNDSTNVNQMMILSNSEKNCCLQWKHRNFIISVNSRQWDNAPNSNHMTGYVAYHDPCLVCARERENLGKHWSNVLENSWSLGLLL